MNKMTSEIEDLIKAHLIPTGFTDVDGESYVEYICKLVDGRSLYESLIDLIQQKQEEYLNRFVEYCELNDLNELIDNKNNTGNYYDLRELAKEWVFDPLKQFKEQKNI